MKKLFLLIFLMFMTSISFSQTINGCLIEYEPNSYPSDSTLFVTLQIKLNDSENEVLGLAKWLQFDFSTSSLQFVQGIYVNFNETEGYQTTTITNPCGSNTINSIKTFLVSGPGREVTDQYINFIMLEFKIIDFTQLAWICPSDSGQNFYFHSPTSDENGPDCNWAIGEWTCFEEYVPVELTSFTASTNSEKVVINWTTATELNNQGFEIERLMNEYEWETIGFVEGHGTTTEPQKYIYIDDISGFTSNLIAYRLKQLDLDGSYEYSEVINVDNLTPLDFMLHQNYPNPFNPVTTISYSVPEKGFVTIAIYDVIGNEVTTLVNEEQQAGNYSCKFNASELHSGAYFYRIQAVDFVETKKMILLR
jgi:hypothetical protein